MKINPIHSRKDYQSAMKRIDEIFDSKKGSPTGNELEILSILVDHYERENFPIESPEPIEAIKFRMEQMGMNQNELAKIIGQKSRASEILNKKRKLSLEMIRKLTKTLNIPSEVLIKPY
ncbi:MAG: helix-turn-helix domain-containing protein [Saprospiraceae bacterium]|nr:helix-turn-helix domain-containing protein [Saprospiraceae bacterium]MBK9726737.1 helix-turn-helix domain-containing protein [Saprospiraceae bacterium]